MTEPTVHNHLLVRAKLVQMFDALERVGGTPIDTVTFHSFAFFVNVLSPLWDLYPFEGSVLKEARSPHFPIVQRELDCLVGAGIVEVTSLSYETGQSTQVSPIVANFQLCRKQAQSILRTLEQLPDESEIREFLLELADSFVAIRPDLRDDAAIADASYSDPAISEGRIVDFAEWVSSTEGNASWNTAQEFQRFVPTGITLNRAEKLSMYMRLMKRRAHG